MRILFCAQDPGSANALLPVIKKLEKHALVKVWAATYAPLIFKTAGVRFMDCTSHSHATLAKLFFAFAPEVVVTGTSAGFSLEKKVTLIARAQKIKTISVIDYWSGYTERFGDRVSKRFRYLSDYICVIDRIMKREVMELGVPGKAIVITGNPHLEDSVKKIRLKTKTKRNLLYISTPFSLLKPNPYPFDEFQVLKDILHYKGYGEYGAVIVKLHPKEAEDKYDRLLLSYPKIPLRVVKDINLYTLLGEATLIVGTDSIVLLEASLAGKAVVSYQPGLKPKDDVLVSNRRGLSRAVYHRKDLYAYLDYYYKKKQWSVPARTLKRLRDEYVRVNAVHKIINCITTIWKTREIKK